jgi:hypothetical protein
VNRHRVSRRIVALCRRLETIARRKQEVSDELELHHCGRRNQRPRYRFQSGGNFTIAAGETKDLDIDFNACASIVATGSGKLMLKPVLHAGEVGLSSAVNGTVIDSTTDKPIVGGTTVVALEQKDGGSVDRVILSTLTDAKGNFSLCPVPAGSYDLVVAAVNDVGIFYAATVTTGVQASTAVGNIPVTPEPNANGLTRVQRL